MIFGVLVASDNVHPCNTAISYRAHLLQGCYEAIESWLTDNQNVMIGVGAAVLVVEVSLIDYQTNVRQWLLVNCLNTC